MSYEKINILFFDLPENCELLLLLFFYVWDQGIIIIIIIFKHNFDHNSSFIQCDYSLSYLSNYILM